MREELELEKVCDEIVAAFRDTSPPEDYGQDDYTPYVEFEDVEYLIGKTWLEIAVDKSLLERHSEYQFFYMTKEALSYVLPGYLVGILRYGLCDSWISGDVVNILGASEDWCNHKCTHLQTTFTVSQKAAVGHWLHVLSHLQGETSRAKPYLANALANWQQWA